MDAAVLRRWMPEPIVEHYDARRTILYALGIGAGRDDADLPYVYEAGLKALPTLATVLASEGFWMEDPRFALDAAQVFHVAEALDIHRPLPAAGAVVGRMRIEVLHHRGAGRGSLLVTARTLTDAETGAVLAVSRSTMLLRGDDGEGTGDAPPRLEPPLTRDAPDRVVEIATRPEQAALYRLSGDLNPLHLLPAAAAEAGFERPILHGLCTFGLAGRAIVVDLAGDEPERLTHLSCRFTAPVFPGETIAIETWRQDDGAARFRARVPERRAIVLDGGAVRWR
ncbi:MaoC/PaaZ C-terminal domain-containing protein [Flavisphingomonas formosensis]|uniref:MaoC/PaaZ C-terminal domain-containing protein n=1 Tax=Flavisphingomonas formosensis TaxID=861534 RepID=UPI0012F9E6F2|nr:MaoC/PaaZ C-terminal domain-containing protein [Sphingomonas formosensis]